MLKGLLVVNAFLHVSKFDEIYQILLDSAANYGVQLTITNNMRKSFCIMMIRHSLRSCRTLYCIGTRTSKRPDSWSSWAYRYSIRRIALCYAMIKR